MNPADFVHLIPRMLEVNSQLLKSEPLYCLHCIDIDKTGMSGWRNETSVSYHTLHKHGVHESEAGVDYLVGFRMKELLASLTTYPASAASRFMRQLDTIDTVEDFLLDCGEEPWPEMELDE